MNRRLHADSLLIFAVVLAAISTTGCPRKPQPPPETTPAPVEEPKPPEEKVVEVTPPPIDRIPEDKEVEVKPLPDTIMTEQNEKRTYLKTVYFDFDEYTLRDDTISTLKQNAAWLKQHSGFKVVIEGHCDERGTVEYNLELGAKRARAIMDYLQTLGIPASRMRTISYGEERPVVAGHDETAWSKNRRAEFTLEK